MTLSRDHVALLFRRGEFNQIVRASDDAQPQSMDARHRGILANALALIGQLERAEQLAQFDSQSKDWLARSFAESALSSTFWRRGDAATSMKYAQAALYSADEAFDKERVAWTHLSLFRLLVEGGSVDHVMTALPNVRRAVSNAGIGQASAYLHLCVSVLEGQMGRLDEAWRHCDIADSLLESAPNLWVRGSVLLNRGCLYVMRCEFQEALHLLRSCRKVSEQHGHLYTTISADGNIGHVEFFTGQFDRAKATFVDRLANESMPWLTKVGAATGLARVHLALGELDECAEVLNFVRQQEGKDERLKALYHVRWAAITHAQLMLKLKKPIEASQWLEKAATEYIGVGDGPLTAAIHIISAQSSALHQDTASASKHILLANDCHAASMRDLQGQFYYVSSRIVEGSNPYLSNHLREQALRIWQDQGIESVRLEIDCPLDSNTDVALYPIEEMQTDCVVHSLSTLHDVAYRPQLLGTEVRWLVEALRCSPSAKVVETRIDKDVVQDFGGKPFLRLGVENKKQLVLVCDSPQDPTKAIVLADVLRLGRAAVAMQQSREEERSRVALWPAPPIESQAGALFVADDMKALLATVQRIAPTNVPILITGETGTGKEVLARTIYAYSARANAAFVPFNCSSVPKDMLDSQLFGHRKGAFTGANENFPGVIRAAAGGTLFLDEIGETTLDVQPKLLRFLESSEVHPLGEVQPIKTDVRIIAATNADLDTRVADGLFREDLFYRLNIVRLHVPPLRERRIEIPALAHHYLEKHALEYRKGHLRLAEETMEYLVLYRWPGNVRQLANEMRRLAALAEPDAVLMPEHLSRDIAASRKTVPASERTLEPTEIVVRIDQPMPAAVQHLESAMIQHALRLTGGRMEETAAMLGISRKGLYLKRVRYGLEPPEGAELDASVIA